jgi:hypothetical protein
MTARRLALPVLLVIVVATGVLASAVGAQDPAPPTVSTTATPVSTGDSVSITGQNWSGNDLVNLEVCGNDARNGSSDCAVAEAQIVGTTPAGSFTGFLLVSEPPSLCPCVVRASSQSTTGVATTPLAIRDVGTALPGDAPGLPIIRRQVEVVGAQIRDDGGIGGWFGLSPNRTLVFTLRNTGDVAVRDAEIALAVGKGDDPSGFVSPPDLGTIDVGQQATYEVPIELGPLAFGEYSAVGNITGLTEPVEFTAGTTHWPWGLILIPVVAVAQFLLLLGRNRLRERVPPVEVVPAPGALAPSAFGALSPPQVIDVTDAAVARSASGRLDASVSPGVAGSGVVIAGSAGAVVVDRPTVGASAIDGLDATIAEELGVALVTAFGQYGDRPLSDPELVQVAAQLAHVTAVRTATRHDLDMATTRSLLVSVFAELTERLQVGDDLGDAVSTVTNNGSRRAFGVPA